MKYVRGDTYVWLGPNRVPYSREPEMYNYTIGRVYLLARVHEDRVDVTNDETNLKSWPLKQFNAEFVHRPQTGSTGDEDETYITQRDSFRNDPSYFGGENLTSAKSDTKTAHTKAAQTAARKLRAAFENILLARELPIPELKNPKDMTDAELADALAEAKAEAAMLTVAKRTTQARWGETKNEIDQLWSKAGYKMPWELAANATQKDEPGKKLDAGKARIDLIAPEFITATADVLAFGAAKYSERNWERGMSWGRCFGALMRHLWAWWAGERNDPESGLPHLAHAACCLMFLLAYEARKAGTDDRAKPLTLPGTSGTVATDG